LVIRDGQRDQPVGTTVEIVGSRKPAFFDDWADNVRLCAVVEGYALATEFRIRAKTHIDDIHQVVDVPTSIASKQTFVEELSVPNCRIVEQPFSDIHESLRGSVRAGFLLDQNDVPAIEGVGAKWTIVRTKPQDYDIQLSLNDKNQRYLGINENNATCIDGILVCGEPGRTQGDHLLTTYSNVIGLGDPFVLDIRGPIKPTLTPARRPPDVRGIRRGDASWSRIQRYVELAHAKL
jgi:hypothetical protein